ncbi:ABC transporter [Cytobacillus suaedae]|nr:ABC transporter [Cytobacillus suaedae]
MSNGYSTCSIFELFLAFLAGVICFLLSVLGFITTLIGLVIPGGFGAIVSLIVGIIGLLVLLLFGFCIFKKVWRCVKKGC